LFDLVDKGQAKGLEFNPLRADLFRPEATALIDEVKLSNLASQRVLARPLLSKEGAGKTRGHLPGRPASGGGIHLGAVGIVCAVNGRYHAGRHHSRQGWCRKASRSPG
jgi:hypothetical protein